MVAFAMMWNWYNSNNSMIFENYVDNGEPVQIEVKHDSIYIELPVNLSAYQLQINYQPENLFVGNLSVNNGKLHLKHEQEESGIYTIMAQPDKSKIAFPIEINGKKTEVSISFKGLNMEGNLLGQMTESFTIENVPDDFVLYNNYPNPFNPITKIDYGLPDISNVKLIIYDILGREIISLINEKQEAGYKSVSWNGQDYFGRSVGAGVYLYVLEANTFKKVKKMILLK